LFYIENRKICGQLSCFTFKTGKSAASFLVLHLKQENLRAALCRGADHQTRENKKGHFIDI